MLVHSTGWMFQMAGWSFRQIPSLCSCAFSFWELGHLSNQWGNMARMQETKHCALQPLTVCTSGSCLVERLVSLHTLLTESLLVSYLVAFFAFNSVHETNNWSMHMLQICWGCGLLCSISISMILMKKSLGLRPEKINLLLWNNWVML